MTAKSLKNIKIPLNWLIFGYFCIQLVKCHDAKDFDDTVLYKIDFEMPNFDEHPELLKQVRPFYTHEKEKYDCVIPVLGDSRIEKNSNEPEASPFTLLQPILTSHSCSYRIEAYWSYEICHGQQVRQYHEEREGKNVKLQVYYLGKWNDEKSQRLIKDWEMQHSAGKKYKTTKIEGTQYPYFEIEMSDGTLCDIIKAPRTTIVRYVCYPHGKNEIYSFKETSSCQYEAIILTSVLCVIPAFHPEESKEVSIKCFNSPTDDIHKPLSMLKQELNELQFSSDDFPIAKNLENTVAGNGERYLLLNKFGGDVDKLVLEFMTGVGIDVDTSGDQVKAEIVDRNVKESLNSFATDLSHFKDFISGKQCLVGGTGWWKYEFCYGRHVRHFHKDKKSETELYLGFFNEATHREWAKEHPDKVKRNGNTLWHHYEKGTFCDRTGKARKVDVKLHCTPLGASATAVSMYLLEPKTCQYILVVESQIVCDLVKLADDDGLIEDSKLQELLKQSNAGKDNLLKDPTGSTGTVTDALPLEDVRA